MAKKDASNGIGNKQANGISSKHTNGVGSEHTNGVGNKHANGVSNKQANYISHRRKYTIEEVALHNRAEDAWVIVESRVYDITKFLDVHPGGAEIMLDYLGQDATEILSSIDPHAHSRAAYELLSDYYLGVIEGADIDEKVGKIFFSFKY